MSYVKCDCGKYAVEEDIGKCEASGSIICPECGVYCPNCKSSIQEDQVLHTNKCILCDEEF